MRIAIVGTFVLCLVTPALCQAEALTSSLERLTRNGDRIRAEFSVTNSGVAVRTVVVKCTMFDKDQRPLGTATGTISNLSAGERDTGSATTAHAAGMEQVRCRVQSVYRRHRLPLAATGAPGLAKPRGFRACSVWGRSLYKADGGLTAGTSWLSRTTRSLRSSPPVTRYCASPLVSSGRPSPRRPRPAGNEQ